MQALFSSGIACGTYQQWGSCLWQQLLSHCRCARPVLCPCSIFGPWGNKVLHEQAGVPKTWSWVRVKNVMNSKKWLGTFVWSSLAFISTEIFHTLQDLFQGIYIPCFALLEVIFWGFLFLQWRNQILVIITRHINLAGLRILISVSLPGDVVWITFYILLFLPKF